ncbi:methionine aminopeptidase 1D, mitochondrial isoform X1 [Pieris napi]|uniref:methionine aminopeptidase 1D, mitochondrial isoform X1 n=1 Tax=Pieris napi TaxID=78633 RepID=UPI001FBB56EA|nr:methionine aminopeptidase 1D, mitochondrial isoform X1 [Pieris napi]
MQISSLIRPIGQFWRTHVKKFGAYEKVYPIETTPSRPVPDHIARPDYITGLPHGIPKLPETKDQEQINGMRASCQLAASILNRMQSFIQPGVRTDDIDDLIHYFIINANAYPSPLHYRGFPKSVCTSVNNVAVHGIPDLRPLANGDIVNVDITVYYNGYHGDCSKTFLVGEVDAKGQELVAVTEECLSHAIKLCGPDVPFCDIGLRIHRHAKSKGLTVLPAFAGHGIGKYFHGPPDIFHMINRYPGLMKAGMTFTIEPVLSHGRENTYILDDGWTVVTEDGSRTAQCEHTILITEGGAEILTR